MNQIIGRGAEAVLVKTDNCIVQKQRICKSYRHPELDVFLRRSRTRREVKVFENLAKVGIPIPLLLGYDDRNMTINMSFVNGVTVNNVFSSDHVHFLEEISKIIAKLHVNNIIHGDLTTSNILCTQDGLVLIDFGLSFFSHKAEDKATDLHVLLQGLDAVYEEDCRAILLQAYKENYSQADEVLKRLNKVESRGRNKKK